MSTLRPAFLAAIVAITIACAVEAPADGSPTTQGLRPEGNHQEPFQGRVLKVIDGASIELEEDGRIFRVRYLGVEIPDNGIQELALQFNQFLVAGRRVEFKEDPGISGLAGDLSGYVYVSGEMVNMAMIANGYATVAEFPASFQHQKAFLLAEEDARASGRGLWSFGSGVNTLQQPAEATPSSALEFSGGTLPPLPSADASAPTCDYSGTADPMIKGIIEPGSGERVYILPGSLEYSTSDVSEANGERLFCTEFEAIAAGWQKSD